MSRYLTRDVFRYVDADTAEVFLGTRVPVSLTPDDTDSWITPFEGERPDAFAVRVWAERGSIEERARAARLWDVIFDLNDLTNPLDPLPLRPLRVPALARVLVELERG